MATPSTSVNPQQQQQQRLQVGDRVQERNRLGGFIATGPNFENVRRVRSSRRVGEIVGFESKRNTRGTRCDYAMVRWDHLRSPSVHAVFRLERIPEDQ